VGTRYRLDVVQELAIGDRSAPVDGSIRVTAPNGPALQQGKEVGGTVYDFTPSQAGPLRLVVSWEARVGPEGSSDICAASQSFDLATVAPTLAQVLTRFSSGPRTYDSYFTLRLKGEKPQDPGKVTVILRARRGTTKPPAPRGKALARFTFTPNGFGSFLSSGRERELRKTFYVDRSGTGITIYPYNNTPFGRPLLFAFSAEVIQNGKRIGGMRSGARCNRKQFSGHSAVKCRAVGLKSRP
jgi:hypothetical protein